MNNLVNLKVTEVQFKSISNYKFIIACNLMFNLKNALFSIETCYIVIESFYKIDYLHQKIVQGC